MAGPISYAVAVEQYVAYSVGWGGIFPLLPGLLINKGKVQAESRLIASNSALKANCRHLSKSRRSPARI